MSKLEDDLAMDDGFGVYGTLKLHLQRAWAEYEATAIAIPDDALAEVLQDWWSSLIDAPRTDA